MSKQLIAVLGLICLSVTLTALYEGKYWQSVLFFSFALGDLALYMLN